MRYLELVELYEKLDSTTKRLEKTYFLSEFLRSVPIDEIGHVILLLEGRIYPDWDERELGVASQMMVKAISTASGLDSKVVEKEWKYTGDLGTTAQNLIKRKHQATLSSKELTVTKVFSNLRKLPEMTGSGSVERKIQLIAELLTSAKAKEARYIVRTVLQDLRVGTGSGSIRDSIVWAYFPRVVGIFFECNKCKKWMPKAENCLECKHSLHTKFSDQVSFFKGRNVLKIKSIEDLNDLQKYDFILAEDDALARKAYNFLSDKVQQAYDLSNDFAVVAKAAKEKGIRGLEGIEMKHENPVKVMLALKVESIADGFEKVGRPAQVEFKYDGFRMEIQKEKDDIIIFTRRLDNVTKQFPEVVGHVKKYVKGKSFILDSEAVGFDPKTKLYLPFQNISQRIKRKYDIEKMSKELPVEVNVFDIISFEGKNMLNEPFKKRRALIEKIVSAHERKILPAKRLVTSSEETVKKFFSEAKHKGNEGIMFKNLEAPYKPGARVGYMIKYKEVMENLDLVIIGAEWGEGKRAKWLSSYALGCRNSDKLLEVGKVSTGLKEKPEEGLSFADMTKLLKPLILKEKGKEVTIKPNIILEVAYEEIQKSPSYSSGYALRFPRVVRLRQDKGPRDAGSIRLIKELYENQRFMQKKK